MSSHLPDLLEPSGDRSLPCAWPDEQPGEGDRAVTVEFVLVPGPRANGMSFLRRTRMGERVLHAHEIWNQDFPSQSARRHVLAWMTSRREDWPLWARHAAVFGPQLIGSAIAAEVRKERGERLACVLAQRSEDRRKRQRASSYESYLVDQRDRFGLDLRRGDDGQPIFVILFRDRWERERFRDWFRYQRSRFAEFAAYLDRHGAVELERLLLREMLATERRVKAAGDGAGGRRPLRFYRGDE